MFRGKVFNKPRIDTNIMKGGSICDVIGQNDALCTTQIVFEARRIGRWHAPELHLHKLTFKIQGFDSARDAKAESCLWPKPWLPGHTKVLTLARDASAESCLWPKAWLPGHTKVLTLANNKKFAEVLTGCCHNVCSAIRTSTVLSSGTAEHSCRVA